MSRPAENPKIELQIAEVISQWMEISIENRPAPRELIAQHPELAPGLAESLAGLQRIEQGKANVALTVGQEDNPQQHDVVFPSIPDFEVLGELGRGGMGVVYEAKQLSLDRIVALKVLPFGAVDPRTVKRFLREAETVAALAHPGIVPIYAVGVHNGLNWFAMQKIDGCPLSKWFAVATFDSRAATLSDVIRIGIEAAEALEHAHQRGVIHRDVKPGNLLVDTTGKVWLTDFGLARRDVDVTATVTGAMLGTPRYMSAEQISNNDDRIDARTDIYSLGATLYEMATGRPPFTSESPLELLTQIRRDEPTPPRQIDPHIPRTLELVLLKCLDKEPSRRYSSAAALAADLKAIRDNQPISAKGLPSWVMASRYLTRHKRQIQAIAVSAACTVATLFSVALLWQQSQQSKLGQVRIDTPAGLYVANIQPRVNESFRDSVSAPKSPAANVHFEAPVESVVTTPMQDPMTLPAGDYQVRLEGTGAQSQTVDIVVKPKASTDIEYVDRREPVPQVDIYQKLSVSTHDHALAVLGKETFEVFEPDAEKQPRFTLSIAELDAGLVGDATGTSPGSAKEDDPPLTFAFNSDQAFQGDYSVARSAFARIERISTDQADLDGDGQSDFLITAARHAAIAAVSSQGKVIWKYRLPMTFEIAEARSRYPKQGMVNEAIVGILPIDDLDNDGINDLVINAALFDSSGFSRPYIFTLSGRDGKVISAAPFSTIAMQKVRTWPWSGLLKHRRQFNTDDRSPRMIHTHFENITMRSRTIDLNNESWGGNSANSALYVFPPLILGQHNDVRVAITATERSVHFINLVDGTDVCPAIKLAQPILRGPQRVRMVDGKLSVLVLTGTPGTAWTKCFLDLCVLGESQPRWSIPQDIGACDLASCAADNSFPLIADLDRDGNDEILSPTNPDIPFKWPKLNCFSTTAELRWTSNGVASISTLIDHALPVGDINGDGIIDLALLGLNHLSAAQASGHFASGPKEGLRLIVDFLSGASGERLGYREEHVAASVKYRDIAEIDYVELNESHLVCSVVFGSQEELKLSSMSIDIDLAQLIPATLARGLTVIGMVDRPENSISKGSMVVPQSARGRWYRRRSGPYANPNDVAVWLAKERKQTSYPNEKLVASWISPTKEPRILLRDPNGSVRCINPLDSKTIWSGDRFFLNSNSVLVLERSDGRSDLVFTNTDRSNISPRFYDSETGKVRFTIDAPKMDAIRFATLDKQAPDRFVYAFAGADTSASSRSPPKRDQGFLLLKIDRIAGRLVWWSQCYEGSNPDHPIRPTVPIQKDLNNDQVTDLITGNADNGHLMIEAIDGRDGRRLWKLPLHLTVKDWPWQELWPMMALVPSGGQQHLLVVDAVQNNEKLYDLKSIQIQSGKEVDSLRRKVRFGLQHEVRSKNLSLHVMAPEKRDGIVGLVVALPEDDSLVDPPQGSRTGKSFGMKMLHVDEQTGKLQKLDEGDLPYASPSPSETPAVGSLISVFTADIDNDQILDQIEFRASGQIMSRYTNSETKVSAFTLPGAGNALFGPEQHASKWYLRSVNNQKELVWYELPSGQVALRFGQGLESTEIGNTRYPRLLSHRTGTLLVGSTPEAVTCIDVELGAESTSLPQAAPLPVVMISDDVDPRYRKAIVVQGLYDRKSFADVIRLALLALGAILLPLAFVLRLIRRRQWSMQAMLFAPALFMVSLVCWQTLQSAPSGYLVPDTLTGVMSALSVWALVTLIRFQSWKMLGLCIGLTMLIATLWMLVTQATMSQRSPGMIGYWTLGAWFSSVFATAAQLMMPMAVGVAWKQIHAAKTGSIP